ncbi:Predicted transcriptional regulator [Bordetella ansorpii]|uniref:Predicted transcriptional regulator n=1 Tax=Bordetella ansorpii TaxID=288768 RepID=A0A157SS19_9BORD|nr:AlpA family phage regulatory protein [Bordetella ansorpii]SAI72933.1 Predicted transcriptional regulator [Bordetella ansorpii]
MQIEMKGQVLLHCPEVQALTGLSRSSLYERLNPRSPYHDSSFPQPVRVGQSSVRWIPSEVESWVLSRPRALGKRKSGAKLGQAKE